MSGAGSPSQAGQHNYATGYDAGYLAGYNAGYLAALTSKPPQPPAQTEMMHPSPTASPAPGLPIRQAPPPLPQRLGQTSLPHHPPPQHHPPAQHSIPQQHHSPPPPTHPPQPRQIYRPPVGTTWQYVLHHPLILNHPTCPISAAEVWILDLFDTPISTITALHAQSRKVIAYFSAGSYEDWRPDASLFPKSDLGKPLDGWKGERWVQVNSPKVREVMQRRMDLAVEKGFDGIDPDNVDGYENKNGLGLKKGDAVGYVLWLAAEGHKRGLAVGLKNGADIVAKVVDEVEFCVQEQGVEFGDEEAFSLFVRKGKPVFHVEYPKGDDAEDERCNDERRVEGKKRERAFKMKREGWSSIVKNVRLDQWVQKE